ncbi:MAG: phosphate ABC transporter permease PstA [Gemmatimonadota bacterium]
MSPPGRPTLRQLAVAERTVSTITRRRMVSAFMAMVIALTAIITTLPLLFILWHLAREGASSLSVDFFTQMPKPVGEGNAGMANAIVGTLILLGTACLIGLPIGIGAGLYLADFKRTRLATIVRFLADVLNGMPSIVLGIFAWEFLVKPLGHFSAWAGGVALAAMMIPMITRTTEEMVRLVPTSLREAALALGYSRARTALAVVLRTAMAGIVTGVLVAVARIAGETAPLLFTAFGNTFWSLDLTQPIAALPLQIFAYAISPYDEWHRLAWAGALVLISVVFIISILARFATRSSRSGGHGD